MKATNWISRSLVLFLMIGAIGCGQGFKAGGQAGANGSQSLNSINIDDQLAQAQKADQDAQAALLEAQNAIGQLMDSKGNINLMAFTKSSSASVQSSGLLAPLVAKLQPVFDGVFNKVEAAKQKYDEARASLDMALAALNPQDPNAAALIAQLQAQLHTLDSAEASFLNQVHMLGGKLTLVISGLDSILGGVTSFIPGFGFIVDWVLDNFVMSDVKNLILDLQSKLLAL